MGRIEKERRETGQTGRDRQTDREKERIEGGGYNKNKITRQMMREREGERERERERENEREREGSNTLHWLRLTGKRKRALNAQLVNLYENSFRKEVGRESKPRYTLTIGRCIEMRDRP